jgi:hypothetical protein
MHLAPVVHRIVVRRPPEQAFALFTSGIARWWPFASHSCAGADAVDVEFEPRVGGAVTETTRDGTRHAWGVLTAWSPPVHFAMTWHPGQAPAVATALSVRFDAIDGGCSVTLEHGGWAARGDAAATLRDEYRQGWALVLGRYSEAVHQEAAP